MDSKKFWRTVTTGIDGDELIDTDIAAAQLLKPFFSNPVREPKQLNIVTVIFFLKTLQILC